MASKIVASFVILFIQIYCNFAIINDDRTYFEQILTSLDTGYAKEKAQRWLLSQRNGDWGWGSDSDTANAIMALQLSGSDWINRKREFDLSTKQLALHYALDLAGSCCQDGSDNVLTTGRVAQYIDAFLSVCKDYRNFYGYDLVAKLQKMSAGYRFEVGYRALALCNAGVELPTTLVEQMQDILQNDDGPDTKAINLLALNCANKQGKIEDERLKFHVKQFASTQKSDGSFGNIWSTAIVVQSLLPYFDGEYSWNATAALLSILNSQDPQDGSFTNQLGAFYVLPILNGKNLGDVNKVVCPATELQTAIPVVTDNLAEITVNYSIWKNDPVTESYSITIQVPNMTSMYFLMNTAQELDERFKFTALESSNGQQHFITSIGDLEQNADTKSYWLYGTMENPEDRDITLADKSVDDFLLTQDGEQVVFWYKPIDF